MTVVNGLTLHADMLGALLGGMSFARPLYDHLFGMAGADVLRASRAVLEGQIAPDAWRITLQGVRLRGVGMVLSAYEFLTHWTYLLERRQDVGWAEVSYFYAGQSFAEGPAETAALATRLGVPDLAVRLASFGDVVGLRALMAAVDASERRLADEPLDALDHWICDTNLHIGFCDDQTGRVMAAFVNVLKYDCVKSVVDGLGATPLRNAVLADIAAHARGQR
jgi:hypothetical protein